jgi:hypothetical protein
MRDQARHARASMGGAACQPHLAYPPKSDCSPLLAYHCAQGSGRGREDGAGSFARMAQGHWRKVEKARQRLVLCRLMIDIMRTVHGAYAPAREPFGVRLETFFIGLCIGVGDLDGSPFSVAKIASYMRVPRTSVVRRLAQLQSWGLIDRQGRNYYLREKTLNSLIGLRSYQQVRRVLSEATNDLTILDTLPDARPVRGSPIKAE